MGPFILTFYQSIRAIATCTITKVRVPHLRVPHLRVPHQDSCGKKQHTLEYNFLKISYQQTII